MTHIQQRRDQSATWTSVNPVLFEGEAGHETDTGKWKMGDGVTAWDALPYKSGVDSVNGLTGTVTGLAPLASPVFTGNPTAPTPATADNDTSVATTAFVQAALAALVDSAPATLDTLNELATALGDDPNFATTMTNALAAKAPLASPALTGNPTAPTPTSTDDDTSVATTAFVKTAMRRPACFATQGAVSIPNETFTTLTGLTKVDERGSINVSSGNFTIPEAGWYVITHTVFWSSGSGIRSQQIKKNGVSLVQTNNPAGNEVTLTSVWEGILAAADVITFSAYQNTGGNLSTINARVSIRSEGPVV